MIYAPPDLTGEDRAVLALIADRRARLRIHTQHSPRRWQGSLRRSTLARAIQGSNTIEGYNATIDEALAVVEDEPPDERTETWRAITGYRNALTYINQASQDPYFEFSKQFLKGLQFMMLGHELSKNPGQWRPGPVFVVNEKTGQTVYHAPPVELVNSLVDELILYLKQSSGNDTIVRAAMAHLNLTMIHPFRDGNGRMARALQTFVLARDGILHPVFSSIEEWLGRNSDEYHAVLAETGQGSWHPERSARAWLRFCLKAHHQQAATLLRRNEEYAVLFDKVVAILQRERLDDRAAVPLFDAALGYRITNARYRTDAEVSELVASRDLRRLSEATLLVPFGERRGRYYRAGQELQEARRAVRLRRPLEDPFDVIARGPSTMPAPPETGRLPGL